MLEKYKKKFTFQFFFKYYFLIIIFSDNSFKIKTLFSSLLNFFLILLIIFSLFKLFSSLLSGIGYSIVIDKSMICILNYLDMLGHNIFLNEFSQKKISLNINGCRNITYCDI